MQQALPFDSEPQASEAECQPIPHAAPSHAAPPCVAPVHLAPSHLAPHPAPSHPAPVFVRHPRARRYVVRVRADGGVRVTIPLRGSRKQAEAFLAEQHDWVARQRQRLTTERAHRAPLHSPEEVRMLRSQAKRDLPPRLLALASAFDLTVTRISIRNQRWRWGSCSRSGHISLNWRLVTMPDPVRDYVLIHELMHLKQMNHSPKFWRLVAAACPDYQAARQWLRHYGH